MLLVRFMVGSQPYAIPSRSVVEVIPRLSLRSVPSAPRAIAGLFVYRGRVTPVLDLTWLLDGKRCPDRLSSRIVVLDLDLGKGRRLVGLLAEGVTDVIVAEGEVQPGLTLRDAPYLGGMVGHEGDMVQLVEPRELLSEELHQTLVAEEAAE